MENLVKETIDTSDIRPSTDILNWDQKVTILKKTFDKNIGTDNDGMPVKTPCYWQSFRLSSCTVCWKVLIRESCSATVLCEQTLTVRHSTGRLSQ